MIKKKQSHHRLLEKIKFNNIRKVLGILQICSKQLLILGEEDRCYGVCNVPKKSRPGSGREVWLYLSLCLLESRLGVTTLSSHVLEWIRATVSGRKVIKITKQQTCSSYSSYVNNLYNIFRYWFKAYQGFLYILLDLIFKILGHRKCRCFYFHHTDEQNEAQRQDIIC